MSLHEPSLLHGTNYGQRFLVRLQREVVNHGPRAHPFARLCDMAAIPRDLRADLLGQLVRAGYITGVGDLVRITEAGRQLVAAPLAQPPLAEATRNPSPHDSASRARPPGSGTRQR